MTCQSAATATRGGAGRWRLLPTYGIGVGKDEFQAEDVAVVDGVAIQDADIKEPFFEVVAFHELDARRQAELIYLRVLSALKGHPYGFAPSKRRRREGIKA